MIGGVGRAPGVFILLSGIRTEKTGVAERERTRTVRSGRTELAGGHEGGGVRFHIQRGLGAHRSHRQVLVQSQTCNQKQNKNRTQNNKKGTQGMWSLKNKVEVLFSCRHKKKICLPDNVRGFEIFLNHHVSRTLRDSDWRFSRAKWKSENNDARWYKYGLSCTSYHLLFIVTKIISIASKQWQQSRNHFRVYTNQTFNVLFTLKATATAAARERKIQGCCVLNASRTNRVQRANNFGHQCIFITKPRTNKKRAEVCFRAKKCFFYN